MTTVCEAQASCPLQKRSPCHRKDGSRGAWARGSEDDLVDGGLLVARARDDVLVVRRDVAAQHAARLLGLGGIEVKG